MRLLAATESTIGIWGFRDFANRPNPKSLNLEIPKSQEF
jgi:hypothetical protein